MGSKLQIKSKVGEGSDFFAINFKRGNVNTLTIQLTPLLVGVLPLKYFRIKGFNSGGQ
jgi:hypothetical protein